MTDPVTLDGEGQIGEFDEKRAENAVRELLIAVGEDPDREGLRETPARVARAYKEIFAGLWQEPRDVLTTTFDLGHDEMVLVKDIEVFSTCEHHLVPFRGAAHVGYIPSTNGKITGLSKLARLVDVYARRPQVQERLTTQIADSLMEILEPRGVIVVGVRAHVHVDARHSQARREDPDVGGARTAARRRHAQRGDEPDNGALTPVGAEPGGPPRDRRRAGGSGRRGRARVVVVLGPPGACRRAPGRSRQLSRRYPPRPRSRRRWPGRGGPGRRGTPAGRRPCRHTYRRRGRPPGRWPGRRRPRGPPSSGRRPWRPGHGPAGPSDGRGSTGPSPAGSRRSARARRGAARGTLGESPDRVPQTGARPGQDPGHDEHAGQHPDAQLFHGVPVSLRFPCVAVRPCRP